MDWLANPLGDLFLWSFGILEVLRNFPNDVFLLTGIVGIIYWLRKQSKYNKEAASNPNQLK